MNQKAAVSYYIRPATPEDNPSILSMLSENSQPGQVQLTFERDPDYFYGAGINCDQPDVYVLEKSQFSEGENPMVGIFNLGRRNLYINGQPRLVRYAHDLRIAKGARGGEAIRAIYGFAQQVNEDDGWMQAVILADNKPFLQVISKKRSGMPDFYLNGNIETSLLTGRPRNPKQDGLKLRAATRSDLPAMQAFYDREAAGRQFAQAYRFEDLVSQSPYYRGLELADYWLAFDGEELVGIAGTWNQKSFRQTRVEGYSRSISMARPLYNAWASVSAGMKLPRKGDCFNYRMIHSLMVKNRDEAVTDAILCHLHRCFRQYHDALICGFFEDDPGARVASRFQRRVLRSHHYMMTWQDRDPREELDGSMPLYTEVARL